MAYKFDSGWKAADRFDSVDPVEVSAINEDERPTEGSVFGGDVYGKV